MHVMDMQSGERIAIDPTSGLAKQSSAEEESNVKLSQLAASIVNRRTLLREDRRLMASERDVGLPRALDTAVTPDQTAGAIAGLVAPVVEVDRRWGAWFRQAVTDELLPVLPMHCEADAQPAEAPPTFRSSANVGPHDLATLRLPHGRASGRVCCET